MQSLQTKSINQIEYNNFVRFVSVSNNWFGVVKSINKHNYFGQGHTLVSCCYNIRLYEYGHEQVKLRKNIWNNKEFLLKIDM
jgi:hypothetical protein